MAVQYPPMVLMLFLLCVYPIICCDCDCDMTYVMLCDSVTESHDVFPCSIPVVISKETKRKRKKKQKLKIITKGHLLICCGGSCWATCIVL